MHNRTPAPSFPLQFPRTWGAVFLCLGLGLGLISGLAQDVAATDERSPLIVSDDGTPVAPNTDVAVPVPASDAGTEPAVVPAPVIVSPPPTTEETVRKAVVETKGLTDPTAPNPTIDSGNAPAGGLLATPLMPETGGVALSTPETSSAVTEVKKSKAITASTPFVKTSPAGTGPVVMGTDLGPNPAATPLSAEAVPSEFADAPVLESTDPWVFGVEGSAFFDDNIRLSNRNKESDFIFQLQGSVAWQQGDVKKKRGSWARVFYEATGIVFAEASSENNVDHDFQAGGQKRWGSLALALEGRYRRLSGATPDLGDRVQRDEYGAKVSGSYDLSGRTFVEAGASYNAVRYQESLLADYDEWLGEGFAGYELSARTRIAAGGAVGRTHVNAGSSQDFQRALVKLSRVSTGSLGLNAKAGVEFRQTPKGKNTTPVFALGADWEPVADSTKISVQAFRETVASGALAGENYLRTGAALRMAQQIGTRFSAGLEAGYEHLEYAATSSGTASGRSDDYFFAKPSLKYEFDGRRHAEVFYSFREDDSSVEDFSFNANQWGLAFGLDF